MYEVELKVRADHRAVRRELSGADPLGTVTQVDTYYDAPHRDFAATDEALRIRRERDGDGSRALVTYKGPLVDDASKTREEFETTVGDGETAAAILEGVGFEPAATVQKERERFRVGAYTVTLDTVEGLGEFVEVEREVEEEAIESARAGATDLLVELGLDPDSGIRTSYLGLLLD